MVLLQTMIDTLIDVELYYAEQWTRSAASELFHKVAKE